MIFFDFMLVLGSPKGEKNISKKGERKNAEIKLRLLLKKSKKANSFQILRV